MNKNKSFQHKVIYGVCMIVILIAVSLISRPATSDQPGGMLAQMRRDYHISDAQLGKVDPASEAMRLSLLGLDGVAITFLWSNLNEYQKTEQYTLMEATAKTISYLNPHLLKVWEFQAWNLSYNVSREFDNYEHRYLWVKRGINYHMDGTEYNYNEPRMMNSIAHFFGNKFGNADEKEQYRELFPEDDLFHDEIQKHLEGTAYSVTEDAEGVQEGKPDHWLVARLWDKWATEVVDNGLGSIGAMSPTIFYQYPAKRLMNFGEAIEKEGHISEKAQAAWAQALEEWKEYGDHELPSTYGIPIKLNDAVRLGKEIDEAANNFDNTYNDYSTEVQDEKIAKLPEETRKALDTPEEDRTEEQIQLIKSVQHTLQVSRIEVVKKIQDKANALKKEKPDSEEAKTLSQAALEASREANRLDEMEFLKGVIDRQKDIVAFNYWQTRAQSESTDRTIEARRLVYEAHEAYKDANLVKARELYEQAWEKWIAIYDDYPELRDDASADVLSDSIKEYRALLNQFDQDISPNFPLIDILRSNSDIFVEPVWNPDDAPTPAAAMPEEEKEAEASDDKPMDAEKPAATQEKPTEEKPMETPTKEETSAESPATEKPAETSAEPEASEAKPVEEPAETQEEAVPSAESTSAQS
ncbi:hypothetical protein C5Y96_00165 [Blastopirellula marina]|uniref:IRE (Iron responsive element) n=1 Tax=Blastopirellula marina TaxID=124 RepID=A0A2S8GBL8_9BACT|nr:MULTISPECIES: hypothetical protein [Pirellulaceae]PQO41823.1 hypothetical protein C5Y96_00165 [Blastopirellula marina]RCS56375.1 hypothetical protein DTL36_00165 [Bremerella cremea]